MSTRTRSHPYQRTRREGRQEGSGSPLTKLVVSSLHYEISEADLVKIFQPYGAFSRNPTIRYDRSGRSTGFAYVNYENEADAALAKTELDGVFAKGQEIRIRFDASAPRRPTGNATRVPGSLMSRLGNTSLINRLSDSAPTVKESTKPTPTGPARTQRTRNVGRDRPKAEKASRAPRNAPKTADDLDKELEAYVQDGDNEPAPKVSDEDVDMAV